jgi:hypothetical protein
LVRYIVIIGWETCDLQLTCNWFNKNIKKMNYETFKSKIKYWISMKTIYLFSQKKIEFLKNCNLKIYVINVKDAKVTQ